MHQKYHNKDKNSYHGPKIDDKSTQEENRHANHRKSAKGTQKTH